MVDDCVGVCLRLRFAPNPKKKSAKEMTTVGLEPTNPKDRGLNAARLTTSLDRRSCRLNNIIHDLYIGPKKEKRKKNTSRQALLQGDRDERDGKRRKDRKGSVSLSLEDGVDLFQRRVLIELIARTLIQVL